MQFWKKEKVLINRNNIVYVSMYNAQEKEETEQNKYSYFFFVQVSKYTFKH
jgi:hypothetical protein